ncbi:MAG: CxxC-x17-CxxC domain-containing protein [Candidatus Paceibacterota bacterium]|jgi:CxxC-x17-CxxC domain-containing protein
MNDFKKNNRFGDKRGGGFNKGGFGRPSFGGGGGKSFGSRPLEMFSATCASCGKTCEVPFKPNGKKPVYCKECFAANGGPAPREGGAPERFAPRRDFDRAPSFKPAYKPEYRPDAGAGLGEVKRSLEAMNSKLDKLVSLLSAQAPKAEAPVEEKKPAKKAASKKKK